MRSEALRVTRAPSPSLSASPLYEEAQGAPQIPEHSMEATRLNSTGSPSSGADGLWTSAHHLRISAFLLASRQPRNGNVCHDQTVLRPLPRSWLCFPLLTQNTAGPRSHASPAHTISECLCGSHPSSQSVFHTRHPARRLND